MVIFFVIAIARTWQLIGVRDTGLAAVVSDLVRERQRSPANAPAAVNETTGDADSAGAP